VVASIELGRSTGMGIPWYVCQPIGWQKRPGRVDSYGAMAISGPTCRPPSD